uniref:Tudor domain-containing protein n=1 Tax=Toxocara canis TaxID=6265 RepID=A0A183V9S5_TOXCA
LQIVAEHEQARNALGPPVVVGNVDLADRRRNYISDFTSELGDCFQLRIPVAGDEDSGFMEVRATRVSSDCDFEMAQIELELEKRNCRVIIYDNGKWTSQKGH